MVSKARRALAEMLGDKDRDAARRFSNWWHGTVNPEDLALSAVRLEVPSWRGTSVAQMPQALKFIARNELYGAISTLRTRKQSYKGYYKAIKLLAGPEPQRQFRGPGFHPPFYMLFPDDSLAIQILKDNSLKYEVVTNGSEFLKGVEIGGEETPLWKL